MTAAQSFLPDAAAAATPASGVDRPYSNPPLDVNDGHSKRVLIVGAGPVGLFLALKLAQSGISVTVIEKGESTSKLPRACGYAVPVQHEFAKVGVYDKIKEAGGFISAGPCWRKAPVDNGRGGKDKGELIAAFKRYQTNDPSMPPGSGTLHFPQARLSEILWKEAVQTSRVDVHFNTELESIQDNNNDRAITIIVKDLLTGSSFSLSGAYLVGADGATSKTRKLLKIPFAGHTWDRKLLATDVWIHNHDEETLHPTSFVMDPPYFCVITPLTKPQKAARSLWRCTTGLPPDDSRTNDELLASENIESLYEQFMAGPRPLEYEVTNKSVYSIHQRLASTMRRGRILLAGDAAHVCNPVGGLGLNTGVLDAIALHDSLTMIIKEGHSDRDLILDTYSDERRKSFQMLVDPMSTVNLLRVTSVDIDKATEDDWFFRALKTGDTRALKAMERQFAEIWAADMREVLRVESKI